jgi:hypothetical protein
MDNRVGEGQGGVAAMSCIDYRVVFSFIVNVNSDKDATVRRASFTQ